jgi:hypothetical protein
LDVRTDLFSFGVVLYEMATGQLPFRGDTSTAIYDEILKCAPVPPVRLNPELPLKLEEIINKALEKERNLRYQHASDIRTDLQRLKRDTKSSRKVAAEQTDVAMAKQPEPQPSQTSNPAVITAAKQHKWGIAAGVVVVLILLVTAGVGVYSILHRPAPIPFQKFTVTQVTNSGKVRLGAVSPDARYVLSVMDDNGLQSLWLRNVPTGSDTQIIPPSSSRYDSLTFSPDGNYIYFRKAQNAIESSWNLYRTPILGGALQSVVQDIDGDISFSRDGQRIAFLRRNDPELGKYRILTTSLEGNDETVVQIGAFYVGVRLFIPRKKLAQAQGIGRVLRTHQDDVSLAGSNEFQPARDEGPHKNLAQLGVPGNQRPQAICTQFKKLTRLGDAAAHKYAPPGDHGHLTGEITWAVGHD